MFLIFPLKLCLKKLPPQMTSRKKRSEIILASTYKQAVSPLCLLNARWLIVPRVVYFASLRLFFYMVILVPNLASANGQIMNINWQFILSKITTKCRN